MTIWATRAQLMFIFLNLERSRAGKMGLKQSTKWAIGWRFKMSLKSLRFWQKVLIVVFLTFIVAADICVISVI